jgi:hypothetical protein
LGVRVRSAAVCEASAAAGWQVDDTREPVAGLKWLGVLRLERVSPNNLQFFVYGALADYKLSGLTRF